MPPVAALVSSAFSDLFDAFPLPAPPLLSSRWWAHLVARRPKLSRRSAFALRASVDSLRGYESEGWAHFALTRTNIAPTFLPKKIEDLREAGALKSIAR
jgi:hypothetical protein